MSTVSSNSVSECINSLQMEAVSELKYEEVRFCWKINGISLSRIGLQDLESPVFLGGLKSQHLWKLKLRHVSGFYPCSHSYYTVDVVLVQIGSSKKEVRASAHIVFPTKFSDTVPQHSSLSTLTVRGTLSDGRISTAALNDPQSSFIVNGMVKVQCSLLIQLDTKQTLSPNITAAALSSGNPENLEQSSPRPPRERKNVAGDFRALLDSEEFSDVQLVTQTKTFHAHKNILAARSPVFAAMFRANMLEAQDNSVNIPDFELQVVEAMLEFIYTGQVNVVVFTESAMDLFRIADKYELLDLKTDCEEFLFSTVKIENAADVLMMACLHNATTLKTATMNFIVGNKKEVMETESFKKVAASNNEVLLELFAI